MPTYRRQEQEPASAEITEVGPNVLRMQLPIDFTGLGLHLYQNPHWERVNVWKFRGKQGG